MIGELATALVGPLAGPELRRGATRRWPLAVRLAVAVVAAITVLGAGLSTLLGARLDPRHMPFRELRGGMTALEVMGLLGALVMAPAVLAGSLADEKARGAMALLLTTRVDAREIVAGRLAGRLGVIAPALLALLPALAWLGGYAGFGPLALATLAALPMAVAFGAGGLAVAASAVARRGRDAILGVFALEVIVLVARAASLAYWVTWTPPGWLAALDPFSGVMPLTWGDDPGPALASLLAWVGLGLIGITLAAWRLRPSCLGAAGRAPRRRSGRGWRVPPVGDRPMRWKEIYIERAGALGWFGTGLGLLLVSYLTLAALAGAGLIAWGRWVDHDPARERLGGDCLRSLIVAPAAYFRWLIEWAIGLRAAVSIASERDRGTWDGLLLSPLTGTEVVLAKLRGSLHALRWLIAAALFAWTVALACGELEPAQYGLMLATLGLVGLFMAAVGVRASLASRTAARAMAITLGAWLAAYAGSQILAGVLVALGGVMYLTIATIYGVGVPGRGLLTSVSPLTLWGVLTLTFYAAAAAMIASEARIRFDRLAGRMVGGSVDLADRQYLPAPVPPAALPVPGRLGPAPGPLADEDDAILGTAPVVRPRPVRRGPKGWS